MRRRGAGWSNVFWVQHASALLGVWWWHAPSWRIWLTDHWRGDASKWLSHASTSAPIDASAVVMRGTTTPADGSADGASIDGGVTTCMVVHSSSLLLLPAEVFEGCILQRLALADLLSVRCVSAGWALMARRVLSEAPSLGAGTFSFDTARLHLMTSSDQSAGTLTLHADGTIDGSVQEGDDAMQPVRGCWHPRGRVMLAWRLPLDPRRLTGWSERPPFCLLHELQVSQAELNVHQQQWVFSGTWRAGSFSVAHELMRLGPGREVGSQLDRWCEAVAREADGEQVDQGRVPRLEMTLLYQN